MIMLQVPILTEHPHSYGFVSRDVGVSQRGGISHPLERQFLVRISRTIVLVVKTALQPSPRALTSGQVSVFN